MRKVADLLPSLVIGFGDDETHGAPLDLACAQEMVVGDDWAFGAEVFPVFSVEPVVILEDGVVEMARVFFEERAGDQFGGIKVYEVVVLGVSGVWV